ncbi:MAG: hypothetical protein J7M32_06640, partial [Deltaproteobacteria bacterium]|nr:hypothetical protein [Deltaproteobacteria bacterium]
SWLSQDDSNGIFNAGGFAISISPDLIRGRLDPVGYHPELLFIQRKARKQRTIFKPLAKFASFETANRPRINSEADAFISVLHVDEKGYVDISAALAYRPESSGRLCKDGDLLVSCINPSANRIAVCEGLPSKAGCSPEFAILNTKGVNTHYLAFIMRTDIVRRQLIHLGRGTSSSRRRIDEEELLNVEIPVIQSADEIGNNIKKRQLLVGRALLLVSEAKSDIEALIEGILDTDAILSGKLKPPTWETINESIRNKNAATATRKAICHLDKVMYRKGGPK